MTKPMTNPECLSAFGDKSTCPTDLELQSALGPAAPLWSELVAHTARTYPRVTEGWNHSGAKFGWSLRLRQGERVLLYLIPQRGRFLVGIVLGAKAVAAAPGAGLPATTLEALAAAPRYAEGTGLRLPVAEAADLDPIQRLTALKMA